MNERIKYDLTEHPYFCGTGPAEQDTIHVTWDDLEVALGHPYDGGDDDHLAKALLLAAGAPLWVFDGVIKTDETGWALVRPTPVLKGLQGLVALRMAVRYGHHWARVVEEEDLVDGLPVDEIERRAYEAHDKGIPGILAPDMYTIHNAVFHETGTGRVQWVVNPDGDILVSIHRRGVDNEEGIISALVDESDCDITVTHDYLVRLRHIVALQQAVSAAYAGYSILEILDKDHPEIATRMTPEGEWEDDLEETLREAYPFHRLWARRPGRNEELSVTVTLVDGRWIAKVTEYKA